MKKFIKINQLVRLIIQLSLITTLFQSCKMADEKNTTSSTSSSQPQIVLAKSADFVTTSSLKLDFDVKGVLASNPLTITCQLNAAQPVDCSNKSAQFNLVADGNYSVKIVAQTKTGKKFEMTKLIIKDGTAPVVTVSSQPSAVTNQTASSFVFSVTESLSGLTKIECSLDNGVYAVCASPFNIANLAAGNHNYKIRAADKAGNISSIYSYSWSIDLSVPTVSFSQSPNANSNLVNASFTFSGTGIVSYQCQLDAAAAYTACTSPMTINNLSAGSHTFRVKGTNSASTQSSAVVYNWQIDNVVPTKPEVTANITANTKNTNAQLNFSSTDTGSGISKFQCALDSDVYSNCTNPKVLDYVSQGSHTFKVYALDVAGNISSTASYSWAVDNVAPTAPEITANVLALTNLTSAQFSFTSTDGGSGLDGFQCALDNELLALCTSPKSYTNLAVGAHQFKVVAQDKNGNISTQASFSWTIDLTGPAISLTLTPAKIVTSGVSNFSFQVIDPQGVSTVKCNWITPVEKSIPVDCKNGSVTYNLEPGAFTFFVEATDAAGNKSSKSYGWDIDNGIGSILKFKSIDAGFAHVCGITLDEHVKCWGYGSAANNADHSAIAVERLNLSGVKAIAAGYFHTCVILSDSTVTCWGYFGNYGQSGAKNLTGATAISSKGSSTCVIVTGGKVKCWGYNGSGILGNNTLLDSVEPVDVIGITGAKSLSVGYSRACAILTDDSMKCWGEEFGKTAVDVAGYGNVKYVDAGYSQSCTIDNLGIMKCWYKSDQAQVISGMPKVKSVSTWNNHTCAISEQNKVFCFGQNTDGQLGSLDSTANFTEVLGLENVKKVITGGEFTCAITAEDTVKCWGKNAFGNLGHSLSSLVLTPTLVPGLTNIKSIDSQWNSNCALSKDGTVKCWGSSVPGNGLDIKSEVPVSVSGLNTVKEISVGGVYSCALHTDGTVSCWGDDLTDNKKTTSS